MAEAQLENKAIDIKWKKYVLVSDRILYLAEKYAGKYSIETSHQYYPDAKMRVVRAVVTVYNENNIPLTYTWLAQEIEGTTFINKTSALENAETSAVWRAIAMMGVWVIDSIASMDEINKANNRWATKSKPTSRFQSAISNTTFMKQCIDEDDFINKIKAKYDIDETQERMLREAYREAVKEGKEDNLFND